MTTFNELLDLVYELTNRTDLAGITTSAIRAATLKAHQTDFYSKDIYEVGVEFDTLDYRQSLDYYNLISNFRALSYFRRVESATDDVGKFIEVITPAEVLDSYGYNRSDIAYVAGRVLEIRSSVTFQYALMGAYVFPIVLANDSFSSWIADLYPFSIVYEAARVVFKAIGYDEQSAQMNSLVAESYALLKASALTDVGY
jgi:hypothetical protein